MTEADLPVEKYVATVPGINLIQRRAMLKALTSDNAKQRLHDLIWFTPEANIDPDVRRTLKAYLEDMPGTVARWMI